ncbi:WD repeat WDR12/YTM1 family ribosome biogenesis protein [Ascoidea rubescens DSM 1968]|uniref:Ribosome biogenesis protein YTM1 n=1 Tax=Ascoidea rubescens DSM 1968 TaxID=1344418 RepID=A0A1D2VEH2_9ASCO|nr:WD40 repeat-like protein [Ascoidea rubescens DSM 1968]ODV59982.1 WD40 repeat-like protein [Ascoidea rubescens DSM 1968]
MSSTQPQIKIKFFTKDPLETLQVPDTALFVPTLLKRYGLSEIVNQLIQDQQNKIEKLEYKIIPFDFLIDSQILTTSIDEYLVDNGLSTEVILNLEYKKSVLPPIYLNSLNNNDWVSSISLNKDKILIGSYDGIIKIYNSSQNKFEKKFFSNHLNSIKDVKWITNSRVISCGNDNQLRLFKLKNNNSTEDIQNDDNSDSDDPDNSEIKTLAILEGHKYPVVKLAVNTGSNKILSASYDNTIGIWSTNLNEMTSIDFNSDSISNNLSSTSSKKRRKLFVKDEFVRRKSPLSLLEDHKQPVEDIIFDANDSSVAYSVSQDHTLKTWDLFTSRCVDTKKTSFSLLSLLQLRNSGALISGSSARHIIVIDPRASSSSKNTTIQSQLVGHKNFVVSLSQDPSNEHIFASASHDSTVKLWDIRSNNCLFTIKRNSELPTNSNKVLGLDWNSEIGIVSGGQDKKIQINKSVQVN